MTTNVSVREFTQRDIDHFNGRARKKGRYRKFDSYGAYLANGRKILTATDGHGNTAWIAVEADTIERLGIDYIRGNTSLKWNRISEKWVVRLSQDNYYNDVKRFPVATIDVAYVKDMDDEETEIYRDIKTGHLYMRRRCNGRLARWVKCFRHGYDFVGDFPIRANAIFRHGGETEKVTYDDWNGLAVHGDTFSPNFKNGGAK